MSDDEPDIKPLQKISPKPAEPSGVGSSWLGEVNARAEARHLKAEGDLAEQYVRLHKLRADLSDAKGRLVAAQERNADVDGIKEKVQKQVRAEIGQLDNQLHEQTVRAARLDAEANEVLGVHEANLAEEKTRKSKAEVEDLDAQIAKEKKRRELDQLRHGREKLQVEVDEKIRELEERLAEERKKQSDFLDPELDGNIRSEERRHLKRIVDRTVAELEAKLDAARKRREDLE